MKPKNFIFFVLMIGSLFSCERNPETESYSFSGKAQKGPFITGSNVTMNELNANLGQTGKSFITTISNDDGSFSLENIELNSSLTLLTANGFYFSEIYRELSSATLSLQALVDLSDKESININVMTHLARGRIEKLVSDGLKFREANEQAKSELMTFLGVTESFDIDFEELDISKNEEYNAALLAFSILLQRYTMIWNERPSLTAELTQLLAGLASDFSMDGQINNKNLTDTLLYNISQLNLIDIRSNVERRYADLGQQVIIPDFEKYIAKFQEKFSSHLYTSFYYPAMASPEPVMAPDAVLPNLLVPADTLFKSGKPYSIAAIVPLNSALTIKFIGDNSNYNYSIGGPLHGWELINEYPNGFTLNSQRQNVLLSMLFHLETPANARIEYYENDSEEPVYVKQISW